MESMDEYVGIVCGECDALSPLGAPRCVNCGTDLRATAQASPEEAKEEESMDQARNYVCKECSSPVPFGHKFCGTCGAGVPDSVQNSQSEYFGAMQAPGKARLILIRGDQGVDGLSYLLQGAEHIAGRADGQILFPEDSWLSPRHANFLYRDDQLLVKDEASTNGVYVRVRGSVSIQVGQHFLCGEQVFRVDAAPADTSGPAPDQTYFYSSPKRPLAFQVTQILEGGHEGMVVGSRDDVVRIGREEMDVNFPEDIYMSGTHATVESKDGAIVLSDKDSRNGTYLRIDQEQTLSHGDYIFLGKQLLRVEMTA